MHLVSAVLHAATIATATMTPIAPLMAFVTITAAATSMLTATSPVTLIITSCVSATVLVMVAVWAAANAAGLVATPNATTSAA